VSDCHKGQHPLVEVFRASTGFDIDHVVRWCSNCGAIVVDVDHDNRTHPGAVMQMRLPALARQR
jgi:hypothetical protein